MTAIVFIGGDPKARHLVAAIRTLGGESRALPRYPFTVWASLLRRSPVRRGDVLVARFLNDHPSLLLSVCKPLGDALTLAVCWLRGIRVFWLCHNVDRETESYWPVTSGLRRRMWSRCAERIVIDDPTLMAAANVIFRRYRDKLFPITLGPLDYGPRHDRPDLAQRARTFFTREQRRDGGKDCRLNILCAGVSGEKYLHFDLLPRLERELRALRWEPRIVVVTRFQKDGGWSRGKHYGAFIEWCERTPSVLLLRDYIDLDEREWTDDVDLIWRTMSDWSFAFTLFNAARARIPVLSYECGHSGQVVEHEGIGATVAWDFSNLDEAVRQARATPDERFERFLARRSWQNGARILLGAARGESVGGWSAVDKVPDTDTDPVPLRGSDREDG